MPCTASGGAMRPITASRSSPMMGGPCSSSVAVTKAVKPEMSTRTRNPCFVWAMPSPPFQGPLDDRRPLLDERPDVPRDLVGEQVRDPDETRAPLAIRKDLRGGVVVRHPSPDHRPDESPCLLVDVDDQLARDHAVAEGDDARAVLEPGVDDEARDEPGVERAHVAQRVPDLGGARVDHELLADGCHRGGLLSAGRDTTGGPGGTWRKLRWGGRAARRRGWGRGSRARRGPGGRSGAARQLASDPPPPPRRG